MRAGQQRRGTAITGASPFSENRRAPWIIFEAGALSKAAERPTVCPYLVDLPPSDLEGPLAQFQAKLADEAGTLDLLQSINSGLTVPQKRSDQQLQHEVQ
jgi:hypothetical protein